MAINIPQIEVGDGTTSLPQCDIIHLSYLSPQKIETLKKFWGSFDTDGY